MTGAVSSAATGWQEPWWTRSAVAAGGSYGWMVMVDGQLGSSLSVCLCVWCALPLWRFGWLGPAWSSEPSIPIIVPVELNELDWLVAIGWVVSCFCFLWSLVLCAPSSRLQPPFLLD